MKRKSYVITCCEEATTLSFVEGSGLKECDIKPVLEILKVCGKQTAMLMWCCIHDVFLSDLGFPDTEVV